MTIESPRGNMLSQKEVQTQLDAIERRLDRLHTFVEMLIQRAGAEDWDYDKVVMIVKLIGWMADDVRQDVKFFTQQNDIPF